MMLPDWMASAIDFSSVGVSCRICPMIHCSYDGHVRRYRRKEDWIGGVSSPSRLQQSCEKWAIILS